MALKFSFNKLRTAVKGFLGGVDTSGGSLTVGEQAVYVPILRNAREVIAVSSDTTLYPHQSGAMILWDASTNDTDITLPAAEAGLHFTIVVDVAGHTSGGSQVVTATNGSSGAGYDYFYGNYCVSQGDAVDQYGVQTVVKATAAAAPEDYDHIIVDSDGTATGGLAGSIIHVTAVDNEGWFVDARTFTTGTIAETIAGIA